MKVLYNARLKKYGMIRGDTIMPRDIPYIYPQSSSHKGLHDLAVAKGIDLTNWSLIEVDIIHKL